MVTMSFMLCRSGLSTLNDFHGSYESCFQPFLDWVVVVFINDILVYSRSDEEHKEHLREVLCSSRAKAFAKLKKYEFWLHKVVFLFHVTSKVGVSLDPDKVEDIKDWPRPSNVTEVQSFVRLVRCYKQFAEGFSKIITMLTHPIRKGTKFVWSDACN